MLLKASIDRGQNVGHRHSALLLSRSTSREASLIGVSLALRDELTSWPLAEALSVRHGRIDDVRV